MTRNYRIGSMFDDAIKTQVQGAIRGARRIGEPKYLSDTSVEITYEVKMADISRVLLPMAEKAPTLKFDDVTVGGSASESTPSAEPSAEPSKKSGGVTGIIIDGTGLGLRPAMAPRILNHRGVYMALDNTVGTTLQVTVWLFKNP